MIALAAAIARAPSVVTDGAVVIAATLTALWIAHRASARRHGTIYALLRTLGAEPGEARAIADLLAPSLGLAGPGGGRLPPGLSVNVTRVSRPERSGIRITRVVVLREQDTVAGVAATEPAGFRVLDERS